MPGIAASVSRSMRVMANASPIFSRFTLALVWMRVGVMPLRESWAVSAMVKHPAWAAPINSSGLVADWPASNRDLNEYGPSKAPLPTFSRPLPSARLPFHSASALCVGMKPPSLRERSLQGNHGNVEAPILADHPHLQSGPEGPADQ